MAYWHWNKRLPGGFYAIMPSPVDGSVWGTVGVFAGKGAVVRPDHGLNPPAEIYNVPPLGFGPRGADIDSQGCGVSVARQRDLGNFDRVPAVLRVDVYATAALAGSAVIVVVSRFGAPPAWSAVLGAAVCLGLRLVSVWQHWNLPKGSEFKW